MIDIDQEERRATPRMIAFLTELASERDVTPKHRERLTAKLNRHDDPNDEYRMPFNEARKAIGWMLKRNVRPGVVPNRINAMPRSTAKTLEAKPERKQNRASQSMKRDPETLLTSGVFRLDGEIYIIVPTRNKKHIAKRLVKTPPRLTSSGETVKFDYVLAPGIIWALYEEHRLPVADIQAMLVLHKVCIYPGCYRTLKAAKSVAAGVGKRHAERLGIPWGKQ